MKKEILIALCVILVLILVGGAYGAYLYFGPVLTNPRNYDPVNRRPPYVEKQNSFCPCRKNLLTLPSPMVRSSKAYIPLTRHNGKFSTLRSTRTTTLQQNPENAKAIPVVAYPCRNNGQ